MQELVELVVEFGPREGGEYRTKVGDAVNRCEKMGGDLESLAPVPVRCQDSANDVDHVVEDLETDVGLSASSGISMTEQDRVDTSASKGNVDVRVPLTAQTFVRIRGSSAGFAQCPIELHPRPLERFQNQRVAVGEVSIHRRRAHPRSASNSPQTDRLDRAVCGHELDCCSQKSLLRGHLLRHFGNYRLTRVHLLRMVAVNARQPTADRFTTKLPTASLEIS